MAVSSRYDCGGYYKNYDMEGEIHIGTGIVKVHDLFNPLPEFMKKADVILCDPPYNQSALSSFYTKAEIKEKQMFADFFNVLMRAVDEIAPRIVIFEIGVPQRIMYEAELEKRYKNMVCREAYYYNKGECLFIVASNDEIPDILKNIPKIDEEKVIDMICKELDYKCICDPCMGTGLVGFYSNKYGKPFVGTELNKKRLGVLLERITTGKRGNIH